MFVIPDEVPNTEDDGPIVTDAAEWMALKPMNCPAHVLIFRQGIKSYRDLPLRLYENGCCHRKPPAWARSSVVDGRRWAKRHRRWHPPHWAGCGPMRSSRT
jgi:threonyl-tRNA synthetase